jgi:hypothetical protein
VSLPLRDMSRRDGGIVLAVQNLHFSGGAASMRFAAPCNGKSEIGGRRAVQKISRGRKLAARAAHKKANLRKNGRFFGRAILAASGHFSSPI